jgi:hypothetical protein
MGKDNKIVSPFEGRDLYKRLQFPWISWSSYSAFTTSYPGQNRDTWYERYVLGIRSKPNSAMLAGQVIGERLATDPDYLPEVPRPEIYEQELEANFCGIDLVGHLDGWSPNAKQLLEYKTAQSDKTWYPKKVNNHGQLDFYCLLIYLNFGIKPEELTISLTHIPVTEQENFKIDVDHTRPIWTFPTTRTFNQIMLFGSELVKTHKEMTEFVKQKQSVVI